MSLELAEIACSAGTEIDNYKLGRGNGFAQLKKLKKLIRREYKNKNSINFMTEGISSIITDMYIELIEKDAKENPSKMEEYRDWNNAKVQAKLLYQELNSVHTPKLPEEKLEYLVKICNELSQRFMARDDYLRQNFAA